MILVDASFIRDEIVEELLQRMNDAIGEVEDEHKYITTNEIIIAGSKIGFKRSEEEEIEEGAKKKRAYGVFLDENGEETLIFSDALSYAVYEREDWADTFKKEMVARWPNTLYRVKPMSMEVIEDE